MASSQWIQPPGVSAQKSNLNEVLSPGLGDEKDQEQLVSGGVI